MKSDELLEELYCFLIDTLAGFSLIVDYQREGLDFAESKAWHGFNEEQNKIIHDFLDKKDELEEKFEKIISEATKAIEGKEFNRLEWFRNNFNYQYGLKKHMARYKEVSLGIEEDGIWRKNSYPHILPKEHYKLNILETIREPFWNYFESQESGLNKKKHLNFHHLNSSQAMCFNLFYPFVMENSRYLHVFLDALKFPKKNVSEVSFEKILDANEGTNFDFYIKYKNGKQLLFEVKLSENNFGSAKNDKRHMEKYDTLYKNLIKKVVPKKYQVPSVFFKNYQVMRHFSYVGKSNQNYVFFVLPFINKPLDTKVDQLFPVLLKKKYTDRVIVTNLEPMVSKIRDCCDSQQNEFLKRHFSLFFFKYIAFNIYNFPSQ